jgi:dTDP-4-amino-4,6-dideoxygalactose transaminase
VTVGETKTAVEALINVFQPSLGEREIEAVAGVFASNWIGRGRVTSTFEERFAAHLDTPRDHVRSVACCTEGLFQAVSLLRIGAGDEVALPTVSFVGMGNAVAAHGATPVFCDVHPRTLNATAETIEAKLTEQTKAIAILHYGGLPCELDEIVALAESRGIALIEDSACSVASTYKGRNCGAIGDIGVWSFDAMKILVTGDGGMMYFRDAELARRAEEAVYLGLKTESGFASKAELRWWEFEISSFGRRAIINDMIAAIGCVQLDRLPSFIDRRREIHERYNLELGEISGLTTPPPIPGYSTSSYYLYWVQTDPDRRDGLARFLRSRNVYTTFRYYPLHLVARYGSAESLPAAETAARSTLCLPIHQSMSDDDLDRVIRGVREFFTGA